MKSITKRKDMSIDFHFYLNRIFFFLINITQLLLKCVFQKKNEKIK